MLRVPSSSGELMQFSKASTVATAKVSHGVTVVTGSAHGPTTHAVMSRRNRYVLHGRLSRCSIRVLENPFKYSP